MRVRFHFLCLVTLLCVMGTSAQTRAFTLAPEQQYMLRAAQYVMAKRFTDAEAIYSQVIASNDHYTDAYIQRSIIRRELGKESASKSDAMIAIKLADMQLQQQQQNAKLYHQRATGYRILRQFAKARDDYNRALSLNNTATWRADLQAMALEEKMGQ